MSKFKKGDKVLRTGISVKELCLCNGETYTVKDVHEDSITLNECFDYDSGGNPSYYYTFNPNKFELVEEQTEQTEQKIVKEFLTLNSEGEYQLVNHKFTEDDIEVPEGAEYFVWFNDEKDGCEFYKDNFKKWHSQNDLVWEDVTCHELPKHCKILWKRNATDVENKNDLINAPKHYNSDPSGIECIELTRYLSFEAGNALKYIWRTGKKDDELQELKKAQWYVNDLIEHDIPIAIEGFVDTVEFETKVKKVLSTWSGWKYVFLNALYWNDKYEIRRAIDALVKEAENNSK